MSANIPDSQSKPAFQTNLHSWFAALKLSWRAAWRIDRSKLTTQTAIRGLIGFVLPLALGVATGQIVAGVSIAGSSFLLAVVGLNYTNRARLRALFLSCVSIAIGAFVGSVTSDIAVLSVLMAGVMGFASGMLVAISVPIAAVGTQSVLALIVLTHFALDPWHAFLQALLMFAGALLQLLLEVVFSPWHRTDTERQVLSTVFACLGDAVAAIDDDKDLCREALRTAVTQSQELLFDSNDTSPQGKAFSALQHEAEQMRLILIVLRKQRQSLLEKTTIPKDVLHYLDQLLQEVALELHTVASELTVDRKISCAQQREQKHLPPAHRSNEKIRTALCELKQWQARESEQQELLQSILFYSDRMVDRLYRVKKLAWTWRKPDPHILAQYTSNQRSAWEKLYDVREMLRSHLTLRSTVFRHAIRLGVTLTLTTALYQLPFFPVGRGYWVPLTAFLILKPDFTTTFARGVARMCGTLGGVILTTLLIAVLKPSLDMLVVIDAIVAYIALSTLFVNYALYSVFVTIEVVILLAFVTPQPLTNVADRAIDTLLGGFLALLIFLIWPTWERSQVYQQIATRLEALRHYFVAVMESYIYPSTYNVDFMNRLRRELRLTSYNAEASVERAIHEPGAYAINVTLDHGLLDAIHAVAFDVLTLEAYRATDFVPPDAIGYQLRLFTKKINQVLQQLAQAIRDQQQRPAVCDGIYAALEALEAAKKSKPSPSFEQTQLLATAESIVRHIDVIIQLLPAPAPSPAPSSERAA
jgi:uncharacterized membrane protein YccC